MGQMEQAPAEVRLKVLRAQRGLGVVDDGIYGPNSRKALMDDFKGPMSQGIKHAEGNPRNHGVLSIKTTNPSRVLKNSVRENLNRFMGGERSNVNYDNSGTPKFVDFMQQKWAPIGVENDPDNLNPNWAPNVRDYLKNKFPDKYERWKQMNLVQAPTEGTQYGT